MREVDNVIQRRLASDVAMINQIAHYIISAGGKRIRPMLVLLFSSALGFTGRERFELAATVEFVHTAEIEVAVLPVVASPPGTVGACVSAGAGLQELVVSVVVA